MDIIGDGPVGDTEAPAVLEHWRRVRYVQANFSQYEIEVNGENYFLVTGFTFQEFCMDMPERLGRCLYI